MSGFLPKISDQALGGSAFKEPLCPELAESWLHLYIYAVRQFRIFFSYANQSVEPLEMMNLQTLPEEVLVNIGEHLAFKPGTSRDNSVRALYSLSLCSRRFPPITRKILYGSIPVYKTKDIFCLARTVLYRHDLAGDVRRLEVEISEDDRGIRLTKDVEDQFRSILQPLCRSPEASEKWLNDLRSSRNGASVAFLLILLPNLTDLGMYLWSSLDYVTAVMQWSALQHGQDSDTSLPRKIQNANPHRPVLSRLSVLRLEAQSFVDIRFTPIMRLPSLRTLSAGSLDPSGISFPC